MTTSTIRAALDTFQQAANRGTAVHLSPELVQELRDALKAEPEGEGPALDDIRQLCVDNELLMFVDSSDSDTVVTAILEIAHAVLARWGTAVTPPSPNKEPGEAFNSASIDELRERTRRKFDRSGLPVPKHFTMNEERRDA